MEKTKLIKELTDRQVMELTLTSNLLILQKLEHMEHYLMKTAKLQGLDLYKPLADFPKSVQHLDDWYLKTSDLHFNLDTQIDRKRREDLK
jgi:hypothetical protein